MGAAGSSESLEARRNREIELQLRIDRSKYKNDIKLLLLGTGESGKSTILKQMRIIHKNGFPEEEVELQKLAISSNIIQSMANILRAMRVLNIELDSQNLMNPRELILKEANGNDAKPINKEVAEAVNQLWYDNGIQTCYMRRSEYQLNDSAAYGSNYKPTDQDILRVRVKTNGIIEVNFDIGALAFRVFDVGGQRSERKKWIHLFDDVHAIIFIVAMSEYDQVLCEDDSTNRMADSIRLFQSICNSRWFVETAIILFLNKTDLFEEKIKRVNITTVFSHYEGKQNYDEASAFVEAEFLAVNQNDKKTIYTHRTCATDTTQVQFLLESTIDMIIKQNAASTGFA